MNKLILNPEIYFPSIVYTVKQLDFLDITSLVVKERLEDAKASSKLNEVYPVRMTDSLIGDDRLLNLARFISEAAWNILNDQGYDMNNFETFISEFWAQEHHKHSGMEQHVHPYGVVLSGFYFLQTPENGCLAEIHDPRPGKVQASLPFRDPAKMTSANNSIFFKPEPGLMLFTNSWLPHSFTRNASDDPATFIHFNVSTRFVQKPDGPIVI
jgi:uncharacterized protein (TIGR02466 family)